MNGIGELVCPLHTLVCFWAVALIAGLVGRFTAPEKTPPASPARADIEARAQTATTRAEEAEGALAAAQASVEAAAEAAALARAVFLAGGIRADSVAGGTKHDGDHKIESFDFTLRFRDTTQLDLELKAVMLKGVGLGANRTIIVPEHGETLGLPVTLDCHEMAFELEVPRSKRRSISRGGKWVRLDVDVVEVAVTQGARSEQGDQLRSGAMA